MAVDTPYTTEARIIAVCGQLAIDLRTDDVPDYATHISDAIDAGTSEADYYYVDYLQSAVADDEFAQQCATWFAVRWLCEHRLNEPSAAVDKECERKEKKLELIRTRKAKVRIPKTRRPVVTTAYTMDNRRWNNQVRVDQSRSTGVAKNYTRPTDNSSPDAR